MIQSNEFMVKIKHELIADNHFRILSIMFAGFLIPTVFVYRIPLGLQNIGAFVKGI